MTRNFKPAVLGVFAAIGITTTMDATGLSAFSALPLLPLMLIFSRLQRLTRVQLGFTWGRWRHYGLAVLYPLVVIGAAALIAWCTGAVDLSHTDWHKAQLNLLSMMPATILVVIVTEEGFFRGWLWGALARLGLGRGPLVFGTSLAFALWHVSAVTLETGFNPPPAQVPVFLVNALLLGIIWALMRQLSGSIVVSSVSHGVWNGLAYVFFGFGHRTGALGIHDSGLYGPEVGVLGVALNLAFAATLAWISLRNGGAEEALRPELAPGR
jgi:uncharacterized protein